ncbi:hypothetical protein FUAX_49430 (plasmid) [Fulvitalea axinellae]|uniref:DUF4231 domain-containing protein n=1 Tax=Fulvitalea axinellae TaxID=1182444 RepID=A0AAU9CU04_9BACT|nr:hypothetical protein FUAX_49430 [Fulvitalea axinellae]
MNHITEEEYLTERLEDQLAWYEAKSSINKKRFRACQLTQLILAALITLSGVFHPLGMDWLSYLVPVLGSIIAILSGVLSLYKFQENWMEYRGVAELLKQEKYLFMAKCPPYNGPNPFVDFVENVEGMISKENKNWTYNHQEQTNNNA